MKNISIVFLIFILGYSCKPSDRQLTGKADSAIVIKSEIDKALKQEILDKWYPLVIDTLHGGYLSDFDHQWIKKGKQNKMIVTQARHLWTLSKAIELYPRSKLYKEAAKQGFDFLKEVMWDSINGGFHNLVEQDGTVLPNENADIMKLAYGNSFAIYGLAAYYKATNDQTALDLAKKGFHWLETHSHDSIHGGYYQFMNTYGKAIEVNYGNTPPKDQNSSIHLMEAFTELHSVWKNELLEERLQETMELIRDTMTDERGYLDLFFQKNWTAHSSRDSSENVREANYNLDHVSFGHDIETAWLLMEASVSLGLKDDHKTYSIAKKMVDHGLAHGYDSQVGGVYDRGYYFKDEQNIKIIKDGKNWWTQVETMNTLLYMSKLYPDDEMNYFDKFSQQWDYIQSYVSDKEYGGFYPGGIDKEPNQKQRAKSQIWKGPYHTFRALMNCSQMLQEA